MFVVLLRFTGGDSRVSKLMDAHKAWINRGFEDGVFLLVGSLAAGAGGAIVAHNTSLPKLQQRVDTDPFVAEGIVTPEILAIAPARADERLRFLL